MLNASNFDCLSFVIPKVQFPNDVVRMFECSYVQLFGLANFGCTDFQFQKVGIRIFEDWSVYFSGHQIVCLKLPCYMFELPWLSYRVKLQL